MPKRVIDFDAMWGSDKLASCEEWAQAEYAWLYGLADASGCFEMTNLRVIWGRVAAIRRNLTIERLEQVFDEFQNKGLLFVWEHEGKRYAHWTGSDVPGRLPPPSWRMRLERLAPPVPKPLLAEYVSKFARGRAASPGGGFFADAREGELNRKAGLSKLKYAEKNADRSRDGQQADRSHEGLPGLKGGVEAAQAQDLGLEWNWKKILRGIANWNTARKPAGGGAVLQGSGNSNPNQNPNQNHFRDVKANSNSNSDSDSNANAEAAFNSECEAGLEWNANAGDGIDAEGRSNGKFHSNAAAPGVTEPRATAQGAGETHSDNFPAPEAVFIRRAGSTWAGYAPARYALRDREAELQRELAVGRGPEGARVKPEALERIRKREEARRALRS